MTQKKMMILLHGFKRNNDDDFARVRNYLGKFSKEYDIKNVIWYDNYNKRTLNRNHLDLILSQLALDITLDEPEEIVIIGYSTGNVVAMYLMDKIKDPSKVTFYGTVPPFEIEKFKWVERLKEQAAYKKKLRKKLGTFRYLRIRNKLYKNKKTEKYPIAIANYCYNKIIKPDGHRVGEITNGYFLLAENDQVVNTKVAYKELTKHSENDVTVRKFKHDQLFKLNQEVFIEWFEEKFTNNKQRKKLEKNYEN